MISGQYRYLSCLRKKHITLFWPTNMHRPWGIAHFTVCYRCKSDWAASIQTSYFIGAYNLHYLLFSGIWALLCHHPYCFPSQSQSLFGIGAVRPVQTMLELTLFWYNHVVVMLIIIFSAKFPLKRRRFVSKQGQPQPHVHSKAGILSPQLKNDL